MKIANSDLLPIAAGVSHGTPSPQLVKAANAFEANFLGELLKPMREDPLFGNGSGLGGDSLGSSGAEGGSMGTISGLASEALAQAIAKRGGFGIAKMVLAQLTPMEKTASQTSASSADPKCGDCAPELTMRPAASSDAGGAEMLGQGNISAAAANTSLINRSGKLTRGAVSADDSNGSLSVQILHPLGVPKK